MYGKSLLIVWIEKYGEIEGNRRWEEYLKKLQEKSTFNSTDSNPAKRESHREWMRKRVAEKLALGCRPTTNPKSIPIIEQYGNEYGYNFRHGKNHPNGEYSCIGYFADGYDELNNIWIEYDEKDHFRHGKLRKNDIIRQNRIISKLKCTFIRIKYDNTITVFKYEDIINLQHSE